MSGDRTAGRSRAGNACFVCWICRSWTSTYCARRIPGLELGLKHMVSYCSSGRHRSGRAADLVVWRLPADDIRDVAETSIGRNPLSRQLH